LPARFDEPDVAIRYGDAPAALVEVRVEGEGHQVAPGAFRLEVRGVGVYGLQGGRDIVVSPRPDASPAAVRGPLLSSVMGAAVHERGYFALHASAVVVDGGCVLFTGVPGAGKSTLAAACQAAGMPVLSDDLVAVETSESGAPVAHPGYRVVKLRTDALERFGSSFGTVRPITGWPGKFSARIPGSLVETPLPVRAIFDLGAPAPHLSLEMVSGAAKAPKVLRRMYRSRMVPALGHAHRAFVTAAAIARAVPIWSLRAPRGWDALQGTVSAVRRTLTEVAS
jgi:hypothetical protein